MTTNDLRLRLAADETTRGWLRHLESLDGSIPTLHMPGPGEINDALIDLAIPHEDIGDVIRSLPDPHHDPELWWLLERAAASIHASIGEIGDAPTLPALPSEAPVSRWFYVYVFLALKPVIEAWFRQRGIPDDIGRHTLADLGRNIAVYRKRNGCGGFDLQRWLQLHFRGAIYQLGRLQFERTRLDDTTGTAVRRSGRAEGPGDFALNVHITDFSGPFRPDVCDASFARAREFFPRHFPEEPYRLAQCHSWLLDPQLADYLPATSNIIQFQRRFTLVEKPGEPADDHAFRFVFGRPLTGNDIDTFPRQTTIQRALVDHVRQGEHWHGGSGWLVL